MRHARTISILPLLIVGLAFALNLHGLSADSFWGDEILTATFASRSPEEVIRWTAEDIHPPLYYLIAGAFAGVTVQPGSTAFPNQTSDWLWRFPSVLAVVATVAISYRLALHLLGHISGFPFHISRKAAMLAMLLLCLAPIAVKYGQEARMHALFMMLSTLSTWLLFLAIRQPQRPTRWLAFALVATAGIYTMYFGFLILAAQGAAIISYQLAINKWSNLRSGKFSDVSKAQILGFTAAVGIIFLLYLPWWPVLFDILRKRAAVGAIEGGVGGPLSFVGGVIQALGPDFGPAIWLFFLLFLGGLLFLARRCWPAAVFAALWLILPLVLPVIVGDPRALQFRYAFVLPVYLAVIACAVVMISQGSLFWRGRVQDAGISTYLAWLLATLSFIATLDIYQQVKPDWRSAAAYLDAQAAPTDIILIGPLWDEGRFIDYYYRGQAQLLTPAAMVTNIERRAEGLREHGGRVWAINRFKPRETPASRHISFSGVVVSEPQLAVYEPALLTEAAIDLAAQAVEAAYPWAAEAEAQGVLDPDPRTAQAAALRAWGDALMAAGRPQDAAARYETAVDIFPGWVNGFVALAEAYQAAGNTPAAVEAYRQAVAFNLNWHGPAADEADALARAGQWEIAIQKYHLIVGE